MRMGIARFTLNDPDYEQLEFDFDYAEEQWRKINAASV